MTKVKKINSRKNMHLHTARAFEVIDEYLPYPYVCKVQKIVEYSSSSIRNVRSKRAGNIKIINALLKVSIQNKRELEKLQNLTKL